jgi:hypothetical protein
LIEAEQTVAPEQRFFTQFKINQKLKREENHYLQKFLLIDRPIEEKDVSLLIEKGLDHTRVILDRLLFRGLTAIWVLVLLLSTAYVLGHFQMKLF